MGLFLKWLDEAYGCKQNEKSITSLSGDGNGTDEKWKFIQLIEKMKSVIVQLASSTKMTFILVRSNVSPQNLKIAHHTGSISL